ncbi:RNA-binding protein, CCR4-NOT complex subunit Rcd1 [Pestalotiopsis sp. IQ-011]
MNPMLWGWNSDPSCIFASEGSYSDTWFCTASSFLTFPNIPIYASKGLQTWRLVSHAYSRVEQFPDIATTFPLQFDGTWASTLRYREATFYVITAFVIVYDFNPHILLFNSTDPFSDEAWSDPWQILNPTYGADPYIFFDDASDSVYVTVANGTGPWSITQYRIDLPAQEVVGEPAVLWNGNGEASPEGPHIYRKDGYYWLLVANGGPGLNHSIAMLRSETVDGFYDFYKGNPVLTNRGTDEYYQTVGHGDVSKTRTVLVTWDEGEWPVFQPVRGVMSGWELPATDLSPPGSGPIASAAESLNFAPGSDILKNFVTWRAQNETADNFVVSPEGHDNTLRLLPSRANLSGDASFVPGQEGQSFIARKGQAHTLFEFSVDLAEFDPAAADEEAGATIFLTQGQHMDVSAVAVAVNTTSKCSGRSGAKVAKYLRFSVEPYDASSTLTAPIPGPVTAALPAAWSGGVRFTTKAVNDTHYDFIASSSSDDDERDAVKLATGPAALLSGGGGMYTARSWACSPRPTAARRRARRRISGIGIIRRWRRRSRRICLFLYRLGSELLES